MDKRNRTIDVIKGISIILILFTHYEWTSEQRKIVFFPFIVNMAVPVLMIITGYVYSLSFSKQNCLHLEDAFQKEMILRRLVRYLLPFLCLVIFEVADPHFNNPIDPFNFIKWIVTGTYGPGSYYIPIMLQMIFVFPFLYFIIEKKQKSGLFICLILNLTYEFLVWAFNMNLDCYRLILLRYIFVITAGIFAFKKLKMNVPISIIFTTIGAIFIIMLYYFNYKPLIVNNSWANTNFISSMVIVPITIWVLKNVKIHFSPLEVVGKASYHIFLVQMAYYEGYYICLKRKLNSGYTLLLVGIILCLTVGIIFYYIDKSLQHKAIHVITKIFSCRKKDKKALNKY